MSGKISITVPITSCDYKILKVLEEHCFILPTIKIVEGRQLQLDIEVLSVFGEDNFYF